MEDNVPKVDEKEILPTIMRFNAIELMSRMESTYKTKWEKLK